MVHLLRSRKQMLFLRQLTAALAVDAPEPRGCSQDKIRSTSKVLQKSAGWPSLGLQLGGCIAGACIARLATGCQKVQSAAVALHPVEEMKPRNC